MTQALPTCEEPARGRPCAMCVSWQGAYYRCGEGQSALTEVSLVSTNRVSREGWTALGRQGSRNAGKPRGDVQRGGVEMGDGRRPRRQRRTTVKTNPYSEWSAAGRSNLGSSFAKGKSVFELRHKQQELVLKLNAALYIPGSQFFSTVQNCYQKNLSNRICEGLRQIIQKRIKLGDVVGEDGYGNDLLGLMLAANKGVLVGKQKNLSMGLDELIDECKSFFFARHETTASLLTFMCLATHPEWQERV
ncbi:hypothetical protein L7F22_058684 [Adiantum nelumboides]|nr:hypothetical protein [Adiantum nelumboides]